MLRITTNTKHSSPAVNNMMQRSLSVLPSMSSMIPQHGSTRNIMTNITLPTMHYSKQLQQQHRLLSSQPPGGGMNLGNIFNNAKQQGNKKPGETLEQFGVDLTKLAQDGKLDPVIGRHEEIRRTLQILGKFYLYAYAFADGNICSLIYMYKLLHYNLAV